MYKRIVSLTLSFVLVFLALVARIAYIDFDETYTAGSSYGSVMLTIDSKRGTIYDKNMNNLTDSEVRYVALIKPSETVQLQLKEHFSATEIDAIMQRLKGGNPVIVNAKKMGTSTKDVIFYKTTKRYSNDQLLSNIIGNYTENEKNRTGLEKHYNEWLTTNSTLKIKYSKDALGRLLSGDNGEIVNNNYYSKQGLMLTVDKEIQRLSEDVLTSSKVIDKGCVIVLDVAQGSILASASKPSLNLANIQESLDDKNAPFVNRSFSQYTAGSVFKIVLAAAALENDLSDLVYECTGSVQIDGNTFKCHNLEGHGTIGLKGAVSASCNTYFIELGQQLGKQKVLDMALGFGIGQSCEVASGFFTQRGNLPDAKSIVSPSDLANLSFGQGTLLVTPLQIASMVAAVANNGQYNPPKIVCGLIDADGDLVEEESTQPHSNVISEATAKKLLEFMVETVESGTGTAAKPTQRGAGGKTATAETGWYDNGREIFHSWFVGFYPENNPKYAIVVFNEDGTSGSVDCCPIFKEIVDKLEFLD